MISESDSVSAGKSEFRPSLKYLLTGWRPKKILSSFPFNDSQERKLRKIIFESWKSGNYLTTEQFQFAAYSLAKECNLKIHPRWEKCGRASDKWLAVFLRRHPNMRDMLMGKQGKPPKRKPESLHSEEDFRSDTSSDFDSSDEKHDSEFLSSESELDDVESGAMSRQRSPVCGDMPSSSFTPPSGNAKRDVEEVPR